MLANPLRSQQDALVRTYQRLFERCKRLETPATVFRDALAIACAENLKGMDAIHATLAERHGCQRFVSTDNHFARLTLITPYWISLDQQ